jgi:tetratricopeptide (TPR) repeat protein
MTASRPDNEAIFHAARDIPDPDRRREYVREACGHDEARIAHIEALLAAADGPDSLLDRPAAGTPVGTIDQPATESPGTVIGPYKLIEQIGEGGMGSVWMAQQTEPVKRLVAVKLIKAGMDTRQVIARFEAERQALALMDHPNIARVLDGGTTGGGRPYFVMDLVKGVPITRYCDEHHLTPRQRLELFIPVCQAVQHAHHKGIIHRDLKPSNVLVAPYDGKPVVKVIDFGVAKAAGQQLTDHTLVTGFGAVVGTLEYMSPEQAELNNQDIDTRSDVYALGVLLYELLAGSPPFSRKELEKAGLVEMLRVIREQEPTKPSTKLSTAEGLPTLAANRGTEAARLTALVRGELDWIVMKALEKDRNRRYETANGFALDVQRYLAGEPVLAAPANPWYRLRKLVRRHRGPVVAAGLVLLTLLVGIAGTTWGLLRAVDEGDAKDVALKAEQQARADETRAREQAFAALRNMTEDVVERKFAQGVLTEDDRAFLHGVIAQYDAFAAIKGDDADSRALRAEGRRRVGNMRLRLGELREAEQDYEQALSIARQLAADFPSRPEFRHELARSYINRGNLRKLMGRPKEAEEDCDQPLSIEKRLVADFPSRTEFRRVLAIGFLNRGELLRDTGRFKEAKKDYDQALCLSKQLAADFPSRPEFRQLLAESHFKRGVLRNDTGRLKEAEQEYVQALRIRKQLAAEFPFRPEYRQEVAASHGNLANLLNTKGRPKEAKKEYDRVLRIFKQLAADFPSWPGFRQELAASHNNRGALLAITGRLKEAEKDYGQALSIQKQLAADFPNRPDLRMALARSYTNLAFHHQQQGNWAAAKRVLLGGRPHLLAALKANPRHPEYRQGYRDYLTLLTTVHAGQLEQANAVRTAETIRDLGWNTPKDAYHAADSLSRCVPIVAKHDKLNAKQRQEAAQFYGDAAIKLLREAIRLKKDYAEAHIALVVALRDKGQLDKAIAACRQAIRLNKEDAVAHIALGVALTDKGQLDEAIAAYREAIRLNKDDALAHYNLGHALYSKSRLNEAIAAYREAIRLKKDYVDAYCNLSVALKDKGQLDEAIAKCREAIRLKKDCVEAYNNLGNDLADKGQFDEAIAACREAIRLKKDYAMAHCNLGYALFLKGGQLDEAIAACREAIRLKKDLAEAHYTLGNALREKGQLEEAIAAYREAIRLKKDYAAAHCNLGVLLQRKGQLDEAIAAYREAIRLKKDYAMVHCNLGTALSRKGDVDEAIAAYREAIRLKNDDAVAHYNLGNALYGKRQLDEAIAACREAIRLKKDYDKAHNTLGLALHGKGRLDEAIAAYRDAIRLNKNNAAAHHNLGNALRDKGQWDEAIAEYREAIRLEKDFAAAHNCLGIALAHKGQPDEAIAEYREAIRLQKDFPRA